ncbi:uncharacterized protein LOC143276078 [Babylonia areolata]|uniref:uncharacterized protein LOC143276078 n=1 Tax=Babylonia areolata TaxID=304850 RepID=UPI003FD1D058
MGCGRSRHRSPSLQPDKEKEMLKENGKENGKENAKRAGKKHKQADKQAAKAVIKREAEVSRNSPRKTTNGKTGEVNSDWPGGGATDKKDSVSRRNWQLEEAIDTPPETVVAVYRSSVPASARASLKAPPLPEPTNNLSSNGSLLNGGSQKAPAMAQEIEMQMEIPDKTLGKEKSSPGNAKPVHITSSQLEFFKMLDEKIEKGADYNSDDE